MSKSSQSMEEEMSRFEQEIADVTANLPKPPEIPKATGGRHGGSTSFIPHSVQRSPHVRLPPPPPHPSMMGGMGPMHMDRGMGPGRPGPGMGPGMGPRGPGHGMGPGGPGHGMGPGGPGHGMGPGGPGPGMMGPMRPFGPPPPPGPMGPMMGPNMPPGMGFPHPPHPPQMGPGMPPIGPMPPGMMPRHQPTVIAKPPTVYSAKPVKFTKNKGEQKEKKEKKKEQIETEEQKVEPVPEIKEPPPQIQPDPVPQYPVIPEPVLIPQQDPGPYGGFQPITGDNNTEMSEPPLKKQKKKKVLRTAAGMVWEDESLTDWDPNDFRIFCGDLGNEINDETLTKVFSRYPSFIKAKVVRDKRSSKSKGYGFASFKDPNDFVQAMKEVNGKYVGNRPIKLRKSTWKDRNIDTVKKKQKEKERLGLR